MLENWILLVIAIVIIVIIIAIFLFLSPSNNTPVDPALPNANNSTVEITPNQVIANNINTFTATVVVKNGKENPDVMLSTNISMISSPSDGVTIQRTSDQGQTFSIRSSVAGKFTITTTANDSLINRQVVDFIPVGQVPLVLSTVNSTVIASPRSVVAGTEISTVTVTLLDTSGKPFIPSNASDVKLETLSEGSTINQLTNVGNIFNFSVTNSIAVNVKFTASVNGIPLNQSATVNFTAPAPVPPVVGQKFSNQTFTNFAISTPPVGGDPPASITVTDSLRSNSASVNGNVTTFSPLSGQTFTVNRNGGNTPPNLRVTGIVKVSNLNLGNRIRVDISHNLQNSPTKELTIGEISVLSGNSNFTREGFTDNTDFESKSSIIVRANNNITPLTDLPLVIDFQITPPNTSSIPFFKTLNNVQLTTVYTLL